MGDALIRQCVYNTAREEDRAFDLRHMPRLVKDRVARYDLAFYKQETILGGVGFNLVSLANNHTLGRSENAILRSLVHWSDKEDILTAGSYSSQTDRDEMRTVEVNGITFAFLAYTTLL